MENTLERLLAFFNRKDENGVTNLDRVRKHQKILRRVDSTDRNRSVETVEGSTEKDGLPNGIVLENGKIIGLGIRIYNEDVYPLKSFEIYLRGCDLFGELDISDCTDMIYLDLYHNRITSVKAANLPSMRIFGVQDNLLESLDVYEMPRCQGIDAGQNRLKALDVSHNPELVELYINDNVFSEIDLSRNPKLRYFYCHNNRITELDTRANPLLRHLNAVGNPMKRIRALAPQREEKLPLELHAGAGGCVGLKFNPVYDAQWKETGEWQQSYYAYPDAGCRFAGWYENGMKVSGEEVWIDEYGASRILQAAFEKAPDAR